MRHHKTGRTMLGLWTAEQRCAVRVLWLSLWVCAVATLVLPACAAAQAKATDPNVITFSYGFLDLADPRAVVDANGVAMLTFACFGEDDNLRWTQSFVDIDAWCTYARNDPNLSAQKTEQTGWALCLGDEEIFWPLQALLYICPSVRDTVAAIESRPLVYDRFARAYKSPHIEFTDGENICQQPSATVLWNPTITRAYGAPVAWDTFPPLVGLAHELVHARQRVVEDKQIYGSVLQIDAMKDENLARYAFYRKVPGNESLRPRPGNKGYYRNGEFVAYFEDMEWSEWSPSFNPVLDVFEDEP